MTDFSARKLAVDSYIIKNTNLLMTSYPVARAFSSSKFDFRLLDKLTEILSYSMVLYLAVESGGRWQWPVDSPFRLYQQI